MSTTSLLVASPADVGALLRRFRLSRNLTPEELAAQTFVTAALIREIEAGHRLPSRRILLVLSDALELTAEETNTLLETAGYLQLPGFEQMVSLSISLTASPLTARELVDVIGAFVSLHTKCWLITQQDFFQLTLYWRQHDPTLDKAANLRIGRLRHESPAFIQIENIFKPVADLIEKVIEAVPLIRQRVREAQLKNDALALENNAKEQSLVADQIDREQERESKARREEQEYRMRELEITKEEIRLKLDALEAVQRLTASTDQRWRLFIVDVLSPEIQELSRYPDFQLIEQGNNEEIEA
jgi:transcriptional regulator with XRE-family HTH domain